jgi:hypothetical protein
MGRAIEVERDMMDSERYRNKKPATGAGSFNLA